MLEKEQFRYDIEILRIIAMLAIVIGHCFAIYGVWDTALSPVTSMAPIPLKAVNPFLIYFSLPIFVGISGYLAGYRKIFSSKKFRYRNFIYNKTKRLYIPGILFSLFYILITNADSNMPIYIWMVSLFINGAGHLWFLYMLYVLYVGGFIAHKIRIKIGWTPLLMISIIISIASCFFPLKTTILTIFFYQFFFLLGIFWGEKHLKNSQERTIHLHKYTPQIIAIILFYTLAFFSLALIKESKAVLHFVGDSEVLSEFQHWFFRLLIGILAFWLSFRILPIFVTPKRLVLILSSHSFSIYIIHQFIIISILSTPKHFLLSAYNLLNLYFPITLSFAVLTSSLITSFIIKKIPIINKII